MSVFDEVAEIIESGLKQIFVFKKSKNWKEFNLGIASNHCETCIKLDNKIFEAKEKIEVPMHPYCLCMVNWLKSVSVGEATDKGINGADFWLKNLGTLPDYYISKEEAMALGWVSRKGNLDEVAPGKMIGGSIYYNDNGKLPEALGRVWYECDIDYKGGFRNNLRIVYSNDGLMFRTDSHYLSFIAIE